MADNTTGQTPAGGRWPALRVREVSCLAAGVVLIGDGQIWYWLADGASPASTPTDRCFQTAAAVGEGLWLQILRLRDVGLRVRERRGDPRSGRSPSTGSGRLPRSWAAPDKAALQPSAPLAVAAAYSPALVPVTASDVSK
ncbi:hypothetical protein [Streptomyces yangpuensis]|uniref:hypothetical protein n=1 Tax=Streptomyces yangpuensis TaxID=1648182 RepID=UPI003654D041